MDKKIDIDTLKAILRDHLEDTKQAQILKDINAVLQEVAEEKEKEKSEKPPQVPKKQIVIVTGLPEGISPKSLEDVTGFITEIAEDEPSKSIKFKLDAAMQDYKSTRKSQKTPAHSLGELFEVASAKTFKQNGILKKPKGPLEFIFVSNR